MINEISKNPNDIELILGHDLDGNIGDWEGAVKLFLSKELDRPDILEAPRVSLWQGWREWGIEDDEFFRVYKKLLEEKELLTHLEVLPGQAEFISQCAARGHKNYIVTNRLLGVSDDVSRFDTFKWVNDKLSGVPIDGVIFSADKNVIGADVFFDDSADNIDNLLSGGCPYPVLVDQPYNRSRTDLDPIRCENTAAEKMHIVISVEEILSEFDKPLGNLDLDSLSSSSLFASFSEASDYMDENNIDPESDNGQSILGQAWDQFQEQQKSINNRLRLK